MRAARSDKWKITCACRSFAIAEVELLRMPALLELSRRPDVERKGSKSAYCRAHGRAPCGELGGDRRRRARKEKADGKLSKFRYL